MGLHLELPVYKASYDLLLEIFQFTKDFSKDFKYTVGESLKNETIVFAKDGLDIVTSSMCYYGSGSGSTFYSIT